MTPTDEELHGSDADAKLAAAEAEVDSWLGDADRPTLPDLVAMRQLLRSARLHIKVVRTS